MKYVLISGGVMSGIGKGVTASSIGVILKGMGLSVTHVKIDPYLNPDAGLMSPFEHGEVFVLEDGGEADLDLGNYERFADITLTRDHNITTGKIYQRVLDRERRGEYLGKTVQVVPHITNEIRSWIETVATKPVDKTDKIPDVCIVELGGTCGDIESAPFVEALAEMQYSLKKTDFCLFHVSFVPVTGAEQKTKPTQHSVKELRASGLKPDFVVARSRTPLALQTVQKLALFCQVPTTHVLAVHDCSNLYRVPLLLVEQNLPHVLSSQLSVTIPAGFALREWSSLADRVDSLSTARQVSIAVVGKYTGMADSYLSLVKALQHASFKVGVKLKIVWVEAADLYLEGGETVSEIDVDGRDGPASKRSRTRSSTPRSTAMGAAYDGGGAASYANSRAGEAGHGDRSQLVEAYTHAWDCIRSADGILIPGGFGVRGVEGKVAACKYAREKGVPFFGICLGMQVAVIEYARNVCGLQNSNSTEFFESTTHPVIIYMPEVSKEKMGGTMRLGSRATVLVDGGDGDGSGNVSISRSCYQQGVIHERHRHRYEVNVSAYGDTLVEKGIRFVGMDSTKKRMEIVELPREVHPWFVGVQYHPEYQTRPLRAHPLFVGFVQASSNSATKQ